MEWCGRRYGDVFTLQLAHAPPVVVVSNPGLAERVLTRPADVARAGEVNAFLAPLLGRRSVLMLDGPEHVRQRRLLLPLFHGEQLGRYGDIIAAVTRASMEQWPLRTPFAILPRMREITFQVVLRVVFGDLAQLSELGLLLDRLLRMVSAWMVLPSLQRDLGPASPWGRFVRLKARVDRLLTAEIGRRRGLGTPREAALDALLGQMTEEELVDELMTLLVAGHETTATSLAWCFALLLRRPDLNERLDAEIAGGSTRLLEAVVREVLRLQPVFRLVSRRLHVPLELAGHTVPAGVMVGANIYWTQRRPDHFPDPGAFLPERFLDGAPSPGMWIPFGGGVRRCLGASFATYEMAVVLRTVLTGARLRPASPGPERARLHAVVMVPARGGRVILEERRT